MLKKSQINEYSDLSILQTSNTEEEKLGFEASIHMPFHLCNAIREKCTTYKKEP
jgi:hypothetical protein